MSNKWLTTVVLATCLSACAERSIKITDSKGKVIGDCIAGYDWHFYGLQDSIDYMLYKCAKDSITQGYQISEERLLTLDFTLPPPPKGKSWNKKLAMRHFYQGHLSETKLGYILAEIEYQYMKTVKSAEDQLAKGQITQAEFVKITETAKSKWLGE